MGDLRRGTHAAFLSGPTLSTFVIQDVQQDAEVKKLNDELSRLLRGSVFPTV
jgi:hypothetical protein